MADYAELVKRLHKRIALTTAGSPLQDDLQDSADAIEELLADRDKALNRLCEFCGVCSEKSRSPFECEIAGFAPPTEKGVE